MRRSLESLSRSRNMDMSKDPEDIANYADEPKTFEEHMRELKDLLSSLPNDENNTENDERITSCKNRVFKSEFGLRYDDNPNVFRTDENSVYRITGIDQIVDIINCGYVRSKEGKLKGGHENEVFWSAGGDKLNFVDERPILETSAETVKDGQNGALSLDDLTAVWIFNSENGKRENKLDVIKDIKNSMNKDEQISVEELNKKIN